jgi:hypothetical protein
MFTPRHLIRYCEGTPPRPTRVNSDLQSGGCAPQSANRIAKCRTGGTSHSHFGYVKLSIAPKAHREEPRPRLLAKWIEHFKTHHVHAEIASQLFTDENEYYWTDQTGKAAAPPWSPGQQVSFKLKSWSTENTAERQRKRSKPPMHQDKVHWDLSHTIPQLQANHQRTEPSQ